MTISPVNSLALLVDIDQINSLAVTVHKLTKNLLSFCFTLLAAVTDIQVYTANVENLKGPRHAGHESEELLSVLVPFDGVERGVAQVVMTPEMS